jgi:hypothetical protein
MFHRLWKFVKKMFLCKKSKTGMTCDGEAFENWHDYID